MAMLRPRGKALKIAKKVVPGLASQKDRGFEKQDAIDVPNDPLEMKIVDINEARGRFINEAKKTRLQRSSR